MHIESLALSRTSSHTALHVRVRVRVCVSGVLTVFPLPHPSAHNHLPPTICNKSVDVSRSLQFIDRSIHGCYFYFRRSNQRMNDATKFVVEWRNGVAIDVLLELLLLFLIAFISVIRSTN